MDRRRGKGGVWMDIEGRGVWMDVEGRVECGWMRGKGEVWIDEREGWGVDGRR